MCGRFAIFTKPEAYLAQIGLAGEVEPCAAVEYCNAYPTQHLPVVYRDPAEGLRCNLLHWGLIPSWAKDASIGYKTSNARSETAAEKPSFRHAFYKQRAVIPIDGWFEWLREGKHKRPYFHHRIDGRVIWIAGLWEHWINPVNQEPLMSFTLLTRNAEGKSASIHDRMPVILNPNKVELWLNPELQDRARIETLMMDLPQEDFEIYPVTEQMNSPKFQGRGCIKKLASM